MKNRLLKAWLFLLIALPCFAQHNELKWYEAVMANTTAFTMWVLIYISPVFLATVATCGMMYWRWRNRKLWDYSPLVFGAWGFVYIGVLAYLSP